MSLLKRQSSQIQQLPQVQYNSHALKMKKVRKEGMILQIRDQTTAHLGLLPANLPNAPLNSETKETTTSSVSVGLTIGCTISLIAIVSFLTIMLCMWQRKKSLRAKALDCSQSPWTQRYRDGTANELLRHKMDLTSTTTTTRHTQQVALHIQQKHWSQKKSVSNSFTMYKDTPPLESNESFSKESDIDPSLQNERRMAKEHQAKRISSIRGNKSQAKRRTKLPDVWCSPILPMPDSARMSPRVRTSVFQNTHGHPDVIRGSPRLSMAEKSYDAHSSNKSERETNSEDSSATMIGLGLMVDSDEITVTAADYSIVDDPSPVEKTGNLWFPLKAADQHDDLICSADKYAALMPRPSILSHSKAEKEESFDCLSRSPSDTSIYTAVSLATLVMEECMIPAELSKENDTAEKGMGFNKCSTRVSDLSRLKQKCPKKSKTVPSLRAGERKSRTSSSRLLDEIFDEKRDARVTRTFTAAIRMMKKNLKARKPPLQTKSENVAGETRPLSSRSLSRRSEVRKRRKASANRSSTLLSHAISPYVSTQEQRCSSDKLLQDREIYFSHSKQFSISSIQSTTFYLLEQNQNRMTNLDFHLPSRLSKNGTNLLTLSPQKMMMMDDEKTSVRALQTPPNKQLLDKKDKAPLRKQTFEKNCKDRFATDTETNGQRSTKSKFYPLLTAKAIHRKSYSLDSCLSSEILGYLHTPASTKVSRKTEKGQSQILYTKRERANTDVSTNSSLCNTTPLRIRKTTNSLLFSKLKHKRISQLIQNTVNVKKVQQDGNRESQYSTDGEYASPTMQFFALYDKYSTDDENDSMSITTTSDESHLPSHSHRRSKSQDFFLS